jgi:hypothetical protein
MNPSELIDKYIADLTDWRGKMLANLRKIIHDTDPEIIEEWKWMGTPSWSHDGLISVANAHKDKVKLTFSQGASLQIRTSSSTPALKAIDGERLISTRVTESMSAP